MKRRKARYILAEFGGFNWLPEKEPTSTQLELVKILSIWRKGSHHLGGNIDECGDGITLTTWVTPSTYDGDELTWLVLLAHKFHVRVEIESASFKYIRVHCHQRHPQQDYDRMWARHPSLNDLIKCAEKLKTRTFE